MFVPQAGLCADQELFYSGRSVLFALDQQYVLEMFKELRIDIKVVKKMPIDIRPDVVVGCGEIDLSILFAALRKELIEKMRYKNADVPVRVLEIKIVKGYNFCCCKKLTFFFCSFKGSCENSGKRSSNLLRGLPYRLHEDLRQDLEFRSDRGNRHRPARPRVPEGQEFPVRRHRRVLRGQTPEVQVSPIRPSEVRAVGPAARREQLERKRQLLQSTKAAVLSVQNRFRRSDQRQAQCSTDRYTASWLRWHGRTPVDLLHAGFPVQGRTHGDPDQQRSQRALRKGRRAQGLLEYSQLQSVCPKLC